jgi:catechol 2,3-dioxygenase-like lactoylglutathione lyase family enzyme
MTAIPRDLRRLAGAVFRSQPRSPKTRGRALQPSAARRSGTVERMLDHVGVEVSDYERSKAFYSEALRPLGLELLMEPVPSAGGFGLPAEQKPFFWISERGRPPVSGAHVAFEAPSTDVVDAFHAAALAAGAQDNGEPGKREIYHPHYYGAFVLDPDGNNVEAVFHGAP